MAGQSISIEDANTMIETYYNYMTDLGVDMENQTQSVSFSKSELTTWLGDVMSYADELRVFMAAYPTGSTDEGRTTVILWPYRNGQPAVDDQSQEIEPYNEGETNP